MEIKNKIFSTEKATSTPQIKNQEEEKRQNSIMANQLQVSVLNKMLPKGYKIDTIENIRLQKVNIAQAKMLPMKRAKREVRALETEEFDASSTIGGNLELSPRGTHPLNSMTRGRLRVYDTKNTYGYNTRRNDNYSINNESLEVSSNAPCNSF
jgi:hypothetical protein